MPDMTINNRVIMPETMQNPLHTFSVNPDHNPMR